MSGIELVVRARARDIGGLAVRRALPSMQRRLVGPFIFLDHMGPAEIAPGQGFDVRPHPHVALATVTYLFAGELDHRDSLGSFRTIRPGDVNWMVAGRGIVHSERSGPSQRQRGQRIHGIQSWVALPTEREEDPPSFQHHAAGKLPRVERDGVQLDVIAGTAYGTTSPVTLLSPTFYVHALLSPGARLAVDDEHEERAAYVVEGAIEAEGETVSPGTMLVLARGERVVLAAGPEPARVMLLGGARLEGSRFIEWNFVASSKDRIERAKDDWKNRRFPTIPGDDAERIELPE